ncbi:unnamed protein product [marine sediment metagenome]|uniref:Uncharacterized protein n=1 Tax=marine sediment metagenome TaxID=412755 RepID=X0Z317_9ZZZZ
MGKEEKEMSKTTDIGIFILGGISILCINALAFVFDAQWINVAITMDSAFIGALITKFLRKE